MGDPSRELWNEIFGGEINPDTIKKLLMLGADPNWKDPDNIIWQPLSTFMEFMNGYFDRNLKLKICKMMLEHGASIDDQDKYGHTVLHYVSRKPGWLSIEDYEVVKFLLDNGASPDIQDNNGKTAFDLAENEEIRELLENSSLPGPKRAEKN